MLTIKLFLAESGSVATIDKDFPLYQGQFQNILLNVFVPLSTLAPDFSMSTDSGQYDGVNTPYVAGTTVSVACQTVKRNGAIATSKAYNLRFVKNISKNGVGYALFERKLPKAFTNYAGVAPAGLTMICNVTNISYGQFDLSATRATSDKGAVTINFPVLTKRIPAVSADYTFDYDTTETPASWYLNGRKVSLADYGLSIAWTPKNQDTISLSVVAENPTTTSVLTTQTVKYDVFPSSDLDAEEPTDPTSTEVLQAQVNSITAKIVEMGDEVDKKQNKSDDALETAEKDVVPAINELKGSIGGLDARVTKNEQDIADLSQEIITGITYIGTMSYEGNDPPTDEQLNTFVEETPGASTAGGNLVIAVQKIPDATDIIYACIYSAVSETWSKAPIPGLELASGNNAGLIQGGNSVDGKLYVKIVNGVIQDITANAVSGYPAVSVSNLGRMYTDIQSIKNGETSVGLAEKAIKDAKGNTIDSYYMPNSIGATRNFVRKYALPVEFNDALYVSANGLVKEVPTTPASGEQFVVNSSSTGYTTLFTVAYNLNNDGGTKFQLSKKNSYNADLFVKAAAYEEVQFVVDLTAGADPNGEGNTTLSTHVTLDTPVTTSLTDISVSSLLNELGDNIITLDGSKGNVYIVAKVSVFRTSSAAQTFTVVCNDMYRSAFHLSTAFQTVAINIGKVGELPQMIFTEYAVEGNNVVFTPSMVVPPENSIIHVVLPRALSFGEVTGKTVQLSIGGEKVFIQSPNGTSGSGATIDDLYRSLRCYERDDPIEYDFLMSYTDGEYYVQQGYTEVEGNPSGDATDGDLTKIKIGSKIYTIHDYTAAINGKLDKVATVTPYSQIYGKYSSGDQTMYNISPGAVATSIIIRDENGRASIASPAADAHIANKAYVDDAVKNGKVASAAKLTTARTIKLGGAALGTATSFDGSANITIPVTSVKEAYLDWGGKDIAGSFSPLDAALIEELSANRLAGLPSSKVLFERSSDGGLTWETYEGDANLVITEGSASNANTTTSKSVDNWHRITIDVAGSVYCELRKIAILFSSGGASGTKCKVEFGDYSSTTVWDHYKTVGVSGWSGWNIINLTRSIGNSSYGNTRYIRLTFSQTEVDPNFGSTAKVLKIRFYSGNSWTAPSNLAKTGHLYSYDADQNATFPATVTAPAFKGSLSGNATSATKATQDGNGNVITSTYATKFTVGDGLKMENNILSLDLDNYDGGEF